MSLKSIKTKIRSVEKTRQVTKAMEAVSAVKMRKSQEKAILGRPYALHALSVLKRVSGAGIGTVHPLMKSRPVKKTCIVLITSDRGLAGSFNANIIRETFRAMNEQGIKREEVGFITIGKRGTEYVAKRKYRIERTIVVPEWVIPRETLREWGEYLIELFEHDAYDRVLVAYTHFVSTMTQRPTIHQLLPVTYEELERVVRAIVPERGKYSELARNSIENGRVEDYIFEPSPETVLRELIPYLITVQIFHALLESQAAEHSARMVAMKNAGEKAEEIGEDLTILYNKARQAGITREVSEIVGGVESMAQ